MNHFRGPARLGICENHWRYYIHSPVNCRGWSLHINGNGSLTTSDSKAELSLYRQLITGGSVLACDESGNEILDVPSLLLVIRNI